MRVYFAKALTNREAASKVDIKMAAIPANQAVIVEGENRCITS
jgi:hypothetical protein